MATITATLIMEHAIFCTVFDQIERVLPGLNSVPEVRVLSIVVEGLLAGHADTEANLAYAALDHVLAEKGKLDRLHRDHKEIDDNFKRLHSVGGLAEAQLLLQKALAASREHFRFEERVLFPLLERVLPGDTLDDLGKASLRKYPVIAAG